jgi:GDP-4-dehydro-6-deoxy-D-mannose reductase
VWDFFPDSSQDIKKIHLHQADLMDIPKIKRLIVEIQPDYILHLAARSSVAESWSTPVNSFVNNTNIFLNILDTVRLNDAAAKILAIGSSEIYGVVEEKDLPLTEEKHMNPANPYAVARVAQEYLASIYAQGYGLDICSTRSFNHCGPGQSDRFVVSGIVKQFVLNAQGKQEPEIRIGDGSIVRDFLDVRDVVLAYHLLLKKGKRGEVYNICSGNGYAIRDIITILSEMYGIPVKILENPTQIRPMDNPRIVGSYQKIQRDLGWQPSIKFEDSLRSMYNYWYKKLSEKSPGD